jgi:hypothetical protein
MSVPTVETGVTNDELVVRISPDPSTWQFHGKHTLGELKADLDRVAAQYTQSLPADGLPDVDFLSRLRVAIRWVLLRWETFGAVTIPDHEAS